MFKNIFRSLSYPNYRNFFFGQGISLIGTWMQEIAVGWMIYRLTGSPFLLGAVGFCSNIPVLLLAPFAGALADRVEKKKLIMINQFCAFALASCLALMTYLEWYNIPSIMILITLMGIVVAIDMPTRQSFLMEIVEKREDIPNAVALNSSLVHTARLLGPSIGGVLIATWGESVCFFLNALSFLVVFFALFFIKPVVRIKADHTARFIDNFKAGFQYSWNNDFIRSTFIFVIAISILGMVHPILLPVYTREVMHGDSKMLGLLMASGGVGSLFGALFLASRKNTEGLVRRTSIMIMIFGLALASLSLSKNLYLSCLILMIAGACFTFALSASNSLVQLHSDEKMRGRVMGIYTQCFKGMTPFGSGMAGTFAGLLGVKIAFLISGGLSLWAGFFFFKKRQDPIK